MFPKGDGFGGGFNLVTDVCAADSLGSPVCVACIDNVLSRRISGGTVSWNAICGVQVLFGGDA